MASKTMLLFGIPVGMIATWTLVAPFFIEPQTSKTRPDELISTSKVVASKQAATPSGTPLSSASDVMSDAAVVPDVMVSEPMPRMNNPIHQSTGKFAGTDKVHQGSGTASIYLKFDGTRWLRLEDFRVTNGPDLVVYLTEHHAPVNAQDVTAGFTKIGALKGNIGNQNYSIPADVKLQNYGAVVIWCERFGVLFSAAPLKVIETLTLTP